MTHYCVTRADIPFGVQAAQLIHAAGQSVESKVPDGTYAIALHVQNEVELRKLSAKLTGAAIDHALIIEVDKPYTGQAMAIGIKPMDRKLLKPFLSSLALVAQRQSIESNDLEAGGSTPSERATFCACSSENRASKAAMPSKVGGSIPSRRATSRGPLQRIRRWLAGRN